ncbi:MAG TPA: hypothetical protein VGV60_18640 [Candidatus Polarisedimenticolia bacterium]|nr:hypothetical protein [Candidatus Polarisedimenticolia bacterium]
MSGRETRDRQVMTLLVQLFGRDVMDRLAGAGFDAPAAMARAGADRLAAEAGIPIAIARRVAIVVEEAPGPATAARKEPAAQPGSAARTAPAPAPQPQPAAPMEPSPQPRSAARTEPGVRPDSAARSKPVERDESAMLMEPATPSESPTVKLERRPARPGSRKRSEPRVAVEPITPPTPAVPTPAVPPPAEPASPAAPASSVASPSSAASTARGSYLDEGDPFVDDVALVSWMGLSSHQPDGRVAFTVSDTILDPAEDDGKTPAGREAADGAEPERPRPPQAAPVVPPARPSTISGSFWTFGRPADPTPPPSSRKPESQPPAATPRRRKHDGH